MRQSYHKAIIVLQGSYTFVKVKFKHFSSICNVHFQAFLGPYINDKLHMYCSLYSLRNISLFHHFKSDVIVLLTTKIMFYDSIPQNSDT